MIFVVIPYSIFYYGVTTTTPNPNIYVISVVLSCDLAGLRRHLV